MAHVELVTGPAGSGKTARVLEAMRAELGMRQRERQFATTLWITPTSRSRRQTLQSLLDDELPVCFGPQVVTFDEFAEGLLRTSYEAIRPISRTAKRKLLRDLIDDLHRRGKLRFFGRVAHTAGFLDLCDSFIAELKREEIWPEHFEEACGKIGDSGARGLSPKDRELVAIYDAYQQRLHSAGGGTGAASAASGLYDSEGRFWSARTLMSQGHRGRYRELGLVVVDGFTDFTRTQYEILATLATWTERMAVTLPQDSAGARPDLFAKSNAALIELRRAFGGHEIEETRLSLAPRRSTTALGHLSLHLFDNPRHSPKMPNAAGVRVLSCVRQAGEFETVAAEVKRLLIGGVPPDEVIVARRSLDGSADLIRKTFDAAGVPAAIDAGRPIVRSGEVRLLLSLLDLEREDWPFSRIKGLWHSTLFRPDWPGIDDGSAASAVMAAMRKLDLEGGREVLLAALARRVEKNDDKLAPVFQLALESLRRLSDELASLRDRATFSTWVDRILALASSVGIDRAASEIPAGGEKDRDLWLAFVRLVEEAKKAESLAGSPARPLSLTDFRRQLTELLAGQTCDLRESEVGRVRILPVEHVRNLDVPHLFLCGLNEGVFPQSRGDDCLYGDAERHGLSELGLPLSHRARRGCEEMLLYYGVATRARQTLTLSFASVNDDGEPLNPSPYLTSVRDLFEPDALPIETFGKLDPVPETADTCVTEPELRAFATREALKGRAGLLAALAQRPETANAILNLAAAAEMAAARFATRGLTNYEGVLCDPRNLKRLRQRFGAAHEFSATELETYAAHPFRFFLECVLGLEELVDPLPRTDYARRGSVLHKALAKLHRDLFEAGTAAIAVETLGEMFCSAIDTALPRGGDSPLRRALLAIERSVLSKPALRYGAQYKRYLELMADWNEPPRPALFEVPFGNTPEEDGDVCSERHPMVEFGSDGNRVRVRGRIDRIDLGNVDGQRAFNVIDYKLSKASCFTLDDLERGVALQLVVYACAARRLGLIDGDLFQIGFWVLKEDGFCCGLKQRGKKVSRIEPEVASTMEAALDRVLPQLAESIRSGYFPIVPEDDDERYNPDFKAVARTSQFRSVADVLEKTIR